VNLIDTVVGRFFTFSEILVTKTLVRTFGELVVTVTAVATPLSI
jgi:hypothetical protein